MNRIEHCFYSNLCLVIRETYIFTIFIDECTVALCRQASFRRFRNSPNRIKLVGKYAHEASVHIIGGISRRESSRLVIFTGNLNINGFKDLCGQFLFSFIEETFPDFHGCVAINRFWETKVT